MAIGPLDKPPAHVLPVAGSAAPQAARGNRETTAARGPRAAFERALARKTNASSVAGEPMPGRAPAGIDDESAEPHDAAAWVDVDVGEAPAPSGLLAAATTAQPGSGFPAPLCASSSAAPPTDHATSSDQGGREQARDDASRRRWLDAVLAAIEAATPDDEAPLPGAGLAVATLVPSIGRVRLHLSWPDGALRVSLHAVAADGGALRDIAANGHVASLRRALAERTPPVALEMASAREAQWTALT